MVGRLEIRAPAQPERIGALRREIVAWAARHGADDDCREALALAVSEALTNVVMHAYRGAGVGDIIVEAWRDADEHLVVVVCDDGHGLSPHADSPGLGLGIAIMARMASDFVIAKRESRPGTYVMLRFPLFPAANGETSRA